jgi:hypothetical protein
MKRRILVSIAVSVFLLFLTYTPINCQLKTESASYIHFDSGITIFSPLNTTYYSTNPILNLTLYSAGIMGSLDGQITMSYSIDGINIGYVPLKSNGELHVVSTAVGTVNLPELSNGQHTLTIRLYGLNQRTYQPKYMWYVNTIQFSTYGVDPLLNQSTNPTMTATPPTPTPSVPEFSWLTILSLLLALAIVLVVIRKKYPDITNSLENCSQVTRKDYS